jgi:hypothetical protein
MNADERRYTRMKKLIELNRLSAGTPGDAAGAVFGTRESVRHSVDVTDADLSSVAVSCPSTVRPGRATKSERLQRWWLPGAKNLRFDAERDFTDPANDDRGMGWARF